MPQSSGPNRVSVIVVSRSEEELEKAYAAYSSQDYAAKELLVVSPTPPRFETAHSLQLGSLTRGEALREALKVCSGSHFTLYSPSTWAPNRLSLQMQALEKFGYIGSGLNRVKRGQDGFFSNPKGLIIETLVLPKPTKPFPETEEGFMLNILAEAAKEGFINIIDMPEAYTRLL